MFVAAAFTAVNASAADLAANGEVAERLEEVIITGSRIRHTAEDSPNPIVTVTAEDLQRSGQTNVADFLAKTPALIGSPVGAETAGSRADYGEAGLNVLDLRNLGTNRTLVLVDGRRHVSSRVGSAAVDIDTIPTDLIEGIDTLTGGASAIYGADGVSGVVNFRLKKNLEGLSLRTQMGQSRYSDGRNVFMALSAGHNSADGRGNIAVAFEYNTDGRVYDQARPFLRDPQAGNLYRNQNDIPDDPTIPDNVPYYDVRYRDSSRNSAVDTNMDETPDFQGTGAVYDEGFPLNGSGGYTVGGSSTPVAGYQGDLFPELKRSIADVIGHFDFSDRMTLFGELKLAEVRATTLSQPSYDVLQYVAADNAYMPAAIRDAIVPGAAADYFGDPTLADGVTITRDNFDLGINTEQDRRRTVRGVVGASGTLSPHARYEFSYVYGVTNIRFDLLNDRVTRRWLAAIDAVTDPSSGNVVCRSTLNADPDPLLQGCMPYNVFGDGVRDPAASAWINTTSSNRVRLAQKVLSGSITGDFGDFAKLPGGPIEYAVGAEYRKESSDYKPDTLISQGETWNGPLTAQSGSFDVKEIFAETNLTVLKNRSGVHLWTVGAAVRASDYSSIGRTVTWKVDSVYAPTKSVSLRGTVSQAVRAPNIAELYRPQVSGSEFITDPCDINELNNGSPTRAANCAQILTALGIDPTTFEPSSNTLSSIAVQGFESGNAGLQEETARTWTAGVVLTPVAIPELSVSADWFDIRINKAVNTSDAQSIFELCVDQPTINNPFCANTARDPGNGFINGYQVRPENVAQNSTSGLDLSVHYQLPNTKAGLFKFGVTATHVNAFQFVATPGAQIESNLDQEWYPRNAAVLDVNWERKPLTVSYSLDWTARTKRFSDKALAGDPDSAAPKYLWAKPSWEQNLQVEWSRSDKLSVWVGINNLFDAKPEFGYRSYPVSAMGRFFYAGLKTKLR
jgi:outer membrane receptor protein involved in Fe transport